VVQTWRTEELRKESSSLTMCSNDGRSAGFWRQHSRIRPKLQQQTCSSSSSSNHHHRHNNNNNNKYY